MQVAENYCQKSGRIHNNCIVIFDFICKIHFWNGCKLLLECRHLVGSLQCCCNGGGPLMYRAWRRALLASTPRLCCLAIHAQHWFLTAVKTRGRRGKAASSREARVASTSRQMHTPTLKGTAMSLHMHPDSQVKLRRVILIKGRKYNQVANVKGGEMVMQQNQNQKPGFMEVIGEQTHEDLRQADPRSS